MIFEKQNEQSRIKIKDSTLKNSIANFLVDNMTYKTLVYIVMLILTAPINVIGSYPGVYVMLGLASVFNIPLIISIVFTAISMLIFSLPGQVVVLYVITFCVYIILTGLINIEGISKKLVVQFKLGIAMCISVMLIGIFKQVGAEYISTGISNVLLVLIGYSIFVVGINVIINIEKKMMYSKEELIATSLMIAIVLSFLSGFEIFGVSLWECSLVVITLVTGYIGGWVSGLAVGTLLGMTILFGKNDINILNLTDAIGSLYTIIFLAIMGSISGLVQTKNKILLALINVLAIAGLEYIFNKEIGLSVLSIEMLIGTVVLVAIPKKLIYKLENIFDKNSTLNRPYEKELGPGIDVVDRIGAMAEVFESLSEVSLEPAEEYLKETEDVVKKYLMDYTKNECTKCYRRTECKLEDEKYSVQIIAKNISERLEKNQDIKEDMLGNNCINAMEILKEIKDIYNNMKLMRIIKAKEKQFSLNRAEEYKQISHVIKEMTRNNIKKTSSLEQRAEAKNVKQDLEFSGYVVYEDEYIFNEKQDYKTYEFITDIIENTDKAKEDIRQIVSAAIGENMGIKLIMNSSKNERSRIKLVSKASYNVFASVDQIVKEGNLISGDSYLITETKDEKNIIVLSDGMGSGDNAKQFSQSTINIFEKMVKTGVNKTQIVKTISTMLKHTTNDGNITTTLDLLVIDKKQKKIDMTKIGASPTYILSNNNLEKIDIANMPMGLIDNTDIFEKELEITDNMLVISTTDGVEQETLETVLNNYIDKDISIYEIDEKIVLDEIIKAAKQKIAKDDVTVIITKVAKV